MSVFSCKTIGELFRYIREKNKYSLLDFSIKLDVNSSYLSRIENYKLPRASTNIVESLITIGQFGEDEAKFAQWLNSLSNIPLETRSIGVSFFRDKPGFDYFGLPVERKIPINFIPRESIEKLAEADLRKYRNISKKDYPIDWEDFGLVLWKVKVEKDNLSSKNPSWEGHQAAVLFHDPANHNNPTVRINIDERFSKENEIFSLLHEYGHISLHSDIKMRQIQPSLFGDNFEDKESIKTIFSRHIGESQGKRPPEEIQANIYSSYLIIPTIAIYNRLRFYPKGKEIVNFDEHYEFFQKMYGISKQALYFKLSEIGYKSDYKFSERR